MKKQLIIKRKNQEQSKKRNKPIVNNRGNGGPNNQIIQSVGKGKSFAQSELALPSVRAFANVYAHPWTKTSARIPCFPISISQLIRTKVKATGIINANGNGFALATVANACVNDQACVAFSSGPAAADTFQSSGPGVTQALSDSQFKFSDFGEDTNLTGWKSMRPVAAGLRVRYTGTTLNASGLAFAIQNEPRQQFINGYNINNVTQRPYKEYPFAARSWRAITRHITDVLDFQFQYAPVGSGGDNWCYTTESTNISIDDYWNMGIYVTGTAGQSFEIEFVAHFEVKGRNLQTVGVTAPSTVGLEKVTTALTLLRHKDNTTPDYSPKENSIGSGIVDKVVEGGIDSIVKAFF